MCGKSKIRSDALCGLWIYGECGAPSSLANQSQRIVSTILVKVAYLESGDFSATKSDLQSDRQNRAVPEASYRLLGRTIQNLTSLSFGERERRAFLTVDGRAGDVGDGIPVDVAILREMPKQTGLSSHAATDGLGRQVFHFPHGVLPRYRRAKVDLAKFSVGCNVKRSHKMCNILSSRAMVTNSDEERVTVTDEDYNFKSGNSFMSHTGGYGTQHAIVLWCCAKALCLTEAVLCYRVA